MDWSSALVIHDGIGPAIAVQVRDDQQRGVQVRIGGRLDVRLTCSIAVGQQHVEHRPDKHAAAQAAAARHDEIHLAVAVDVRRGHGARVATARRQRHRRKSELRARRRRRSKRSRRGFARRSCGNPARAQRSIPGWVGIAGRRRCTTDLETCRRQRDRDNTPSTR